MILLYIRTSHINHTNRDKYDATNTVWWHKIKEKIIFKTLGLLRCG